MCETKLALTITIHGNQLGSNKDLVSSSLLSYYYSALNNLYLFRGFFLVLVNHCRERPEIMYIRLRSVDVDRYPPFKHDSHVINNNYQYT